MSYLGISPNLEMANIPKPLISAFIYHHTWCRFLARSVYRNQKLCDNGDVTILDLSKYLKKLLFYTCLSGRSEFIWANICEILVDLYLSYYCVSFN